MENLDTPPSTCSVFVINLDRRPDRLQKIDTSLKNLGLLYERVSAIDAHSKELSWSSQKFLTPGLAANWLSHQKTLELFSKTEAEFALILEDDADVQDSKISMNSLSKWMLTMKKHNLSILQVGFISHIYRLSRPRGFLDLLLALRAGRFFQDKTLKLRLVIGEFRGGAHAYLVDRKMAKELIGANLPPFLSTDNFFESLARHGGAYRIARLFKSEIEQESRHRERQLPDSDV